jgi:hypothetical protein
MLHLCSSTSRDEAANLDVIYRCLKNGAQSPKGLKE